MTDVDDDEALFDLGLLAERIADRKLVRQLSGVFVGAYAADRHAVQFKLHPAEVWGATWWSG